MSFIVVEATPARHEMTKMQSDFMDALEGLQIDWRFRLANGDLDGEATLDGNKACRLYAYAWPWEAANLTLAARVTPQTAPMVFEILRRTAGEIQAALVPKENDRHC